jgi:hypothetical protein
MVVPFVYSFLFNRRRPNPRAEERAKFGRSDAVFERDKSAWVFELKVARKTEEENKLAEEALK